MYKTSICFYMEVDIVVLGPGYGSPHRPGQPTPTIVPQYGMQHAPLIVANTPDLAQVHPKKEDWRPTTSLLRIITRNDKDFFSSCRIPYNESHLLSFANNLFKTIQTYPLPLNITESRISSCSKEIWSMPLSFFFANRETVRDLCRDINSDLILRDL